MSWLTDFVRPRISKLVRKADVPDNLWTKCQQCEQMVFHREWQDNLQVCPHCDWHGRLSGKERLNSFFDQQEYTILNVPSVSQDPLGFRDSKRYIDRLREMRQITGSDDAVLIAKGPMNGVLTVVAAFDFRFIGGSLSLYGGESLLTGMEMACHLKVPFVVVSSSGGARMQEGILALMQMPRTVLGVAQMKEARLPYITVLADPTTGGVAASFASLGDIILAEPGAVIGFTGARVIEETLRTPVPDGFQSAQFQKDHGFVDSIVHRHSLKDKIGLLIDLLMKKKDSQTKNFKKYFNNFSL